MTRYIAEARESGPRSKFVRIAEVNELDSAKGIAAMGGTHARVLDGDTGEIYWTSSEEKAPSA